MELMNSLRGFRNNNPLNIERTNDKWKGMSADQSGDDRFVVFDSVEYGIRAAAVILSNYRARGVYTLSGIINTWAPSSDDNNTAAYIEHVSQEIGIAPFEEVRPSQYANLIAAMIKHENGFNPYTLAFIESGVAMA